jgi:hypothetical protein
MEAEPDSNTLISSCNLDDGQVPKEEFLWMWHQIIKSQKEWNDYNFHLSAICTCERVKIHRIQDFNVRPPYVSTTCFYTAA